MSQIEISEATAELPGLIERARAGEEVTLASDGIVIARLVATSSSDAMKKPSRVLGVLEGKYKIPDDFDAPLPDDLLDLFYYGPIFSDDPPVEEMKRRVEERLKIER